MRKIIITLFMTMVTFLSISAIDLADTSAQDIWAYTFKDGREVYVRTETVRYSTDYRFPQYIDLNVGIMRKWPDGDIRGPIEYNYVYDKRKGTWQLSAGMCWYDFDDPHVQKNYPWAYPVFVIARKYAR